MDPDEVGEVGLGLMGVGGPNPGIHSHLQFPVVSSYTGCFSEIHMILEQTGGSIAFVGVGNGELASAFAARSWISDGSRPGMYLQKQLLVV